MGKKHTLYVALVLLVLLVIVFVLWQKGILKMEVAPVPTPAGTPPPAESLGASLYQDAQNPIKDNLDTTNPFDGAYRNPFE